MATDITNLRAIETLVRNYVANTEMDAPATGKLSFEICELFREKPAKTHLTLVYGPRESGKTVFAEGLKSRMAKPVRVSSPGRESSVEIADVLIVEGDCPESYVYRNLPHIGKRLPDHIILILPDDMSRCQDWVRSMILNFQSNTTRMFTLDKQVRGMDMDEFLDKHSMRGVTK